jgi:hypothetical protein
MNTNTILIANIINKMRQYQKENNIKRQCITNTQFLYHLIKDNSNSKVEVKAVIVYGTNEEEDALVVVEGHLVIIIDDDVMIDPSYDVFNIKNNNYCYTFKEFIKVFNDIKILKETLDVKKMIQTHINFTGYANDINNDIFTITEREHYDKQADFIGKYFNLKCFEPTL